MNKKFFTLVLGVFLSVFAFTSANAQVSWLKTTDWATTAAGNLVPADDEAAKIPESCGRFIIGNKTGAVVLVMTKNTAGEYEIQWANYGTAKVFESMWEVIPTGYKYGGMQFQFINVAHGMAMTIDTKTKKVCVDGDQIEFSWFTGTEDLKHGTPPAVEGAKEIFVRKASDKNALLALSEPVVGKVSLVDRTNANINASSNTNLLELFNPRKFAVTAAMLNELKGLDADGNSLDGFSLSFKEEPNSKYAKAWQKNIFTATDLFAKDATGGAVTLQTWASKKQEDESYIEVAKAYHNETGLPYLKFAYAKDDVVSVNNMTEMLALSNSNVAALKTMIGPAGAGIGLDNNVKGASQLLFVDDSNNALDTEDKFKAAYDAKDARVVATFKAIKNVINGTTIEKLKVPFYSDATNGFFINQATIDAFKKEGILDVLYLDTKVKGRREFIFTYWPSDARLTMEVSQNGVAGYTGVVADGRVEDWDLMLMNVATPNLAKGAKNAYVDIADIGKNSEVTILNAANPIDVAYLAKLNTKISPVGLGHGICSSPIQFEELEEGVYLIENYDATAKALRQVVTPIYEDANFASIPGSKPVRSIVKESLQDYKQMPAAQWIVKKVNKSSNSRYYVFNREFPSVTLKGVVSESFWFYKETSNGKPTGYLNVFGWGETGSYKLTKIDKKILDDPYLGHFHITDSASHHDTYAMNYLNKLSENAFINVTADNDSTVFVQENNKAWLKFDVKDLSVLPGVQQYEKYGATGAEILALDGKTPLCAQLVRSHYTLRVRDAAKKTNNGRWLTTETDGGIVKYAVTSDKTKASVFILKLENVKDGKNYYAFKDITPSPQMKVGVHDATLGLRAEKMQEVRTSAFYPKLLDDPLYRQLNRDGKFGENGKANNPDTLVFYDVLNENRVLFEDANSVYALKNNEDPTADQGANKLDSLRSDILDQINYLGLHSTKEITKNDAIYVDTAFVVRPNAMAPHYTVNGESVLVKPQYLLVVNPQVKESEEVCGATTDAFVRGRYLIATWKSYNMGAGTPTRRGADYLYKSTTYPKGFIQKVKDVEWQRDYQRLVFVDAIHIGDSLYVNYGNADIDFEKITVKYLEGFVGAKHGVARIDLANNLHKPEVFQFRLVDATAPLDKAQNFMIESFETDEQMVAPFAGGWLKNQNGVPVLTSDGGKAKATSYENAMKNGLTMNVKKTSEKPVANEAIATTEFRVVAENGSLNIMNAAGKRVVVSNILGQTVANTVLSSDNATVEVPAGIVVVAVEGEAAVKAIVR